MANKKSRYFALFAAVITVLSVQVFGQAPGAAPPSPTPAGGKENDAVLQAVSDVAKAAIEANRVTMEQTAAFYEQNADQESRFFTTIATVGGGLVAAFAFLLSFFGIRSVREYVNRHINKLRQETSEKCGEITRDFSNQLNDRFDNVMKQIQVKADSTLEAKQRNSEATTLINLATHPNTLSEEKEELYSKALIFLDKNLKIAPNIQPKTLAFTYALRAYISKHRQDIPGALDDITNALDLDQDNASYYYNAACYNNLKGDQEKARNLLRTACALDPIYEHSSSTDPDLQGL